MGTALITVTLLASSGLLLIPDTHIFFQKMQGKNKPDASRLGPVVGWWSIYPPLFSHLPCSQVSKFPFPQKTTGFSFYKLLLCWGRKWILCQPDQPSLWSLSTLQPRGTCCLSHSPAPTIKAPYGKALSPALNTPGLAQACISHLGPHSASATTQEASRATSGSLQGLFSPGYLL